MEQCYLFQRTCMSTVFTVHLQCMIFLLGTAMFVTFAALVRHVYDFKPWISKSLFLIWFPLRLLVHVYTVSDIWTYHISLSYNPSFYTSALFSFAPLPAIFVYSILCFTKYSGFSSFLVFFIDMSLSLSLCKRLQRF